MMDEIFRSRLDLSGWVIHFVHDRKSEDHVEDLKDIAELEGFEGAVRMPDFYDQEGKRHNILTEYEENEYEIDENAPAINVLMKILHDGYIHSGWSLRDYTPTIFGPRSAVCFTEMPLYALIEYARFRGDYSGYVGNYGIAFRRNELFAAGARPVIYGISKKSNESASAYNKRVRDEAKTELPSHELYRYVYTHLPKDPNNYSIDWTHEREWRWGLPDNALGVPGLPFFLSKEYGEFFSEIIIIVGSDAEQQQVLMHLKNLYDSGGTSTGLEYNINMIAAAKVLSLEPLNKLEPQRLLTIRLDDLDLKQIPIMPLIEVGKELEARVKEAIQIAGNIAKESVTEFLDKNPDFDEQKGYWGWATVCTTVQSEITQALQNIGVCRTFSDGVYRLRIDEYRTGNLELLSIGAEAAANYLKKELGQEFHVRTRLD